MREADKSDSDHHYQEAGECATQINCRPVEDDAESHYQTPRMSRMSSKYDWLIFKKICYTYFSQIGEQILYKLVVKSRRGHSDSRRQQHHEGGGGDDGGGFHQDGDNPLTLGPGCARQIMRINVDT